MIISTDSGADSCSVSIRTPDRQKEGSTTSRSDVERPKGGPEGARRVAPSNPSAGKLLTKIFPPFFTSNTPHGRTSDIK